MPGDARSLILEVQPYQDGNRAQNHPLWWLHSVSNIYKHKTLHYVTQALVTGGYTVVKQRNVHSATSLRRRVFFSPVGG